MAPVLSVIQRNANTNEMSKPRHASELFGHRVPTAWDEEAPEPVHASSHHKTHCNSAPPDYGFSETNPRPCKSDSACDASASVVVLWAHDALSNGCISHPQEHRAHRGANERTLGYWTEFVSKVIHESHWPWPVASFPASCLSYFAPATDNVLRVVVCMRMEAGRLKLAENNEHLAGTLMRLSEIIEDKGCTA